MRSFSQYQTVKRMRKQLNQLPDFLQGPKLLTEHSSCRPKMIHPWLKKTGSVGSTSTFVMGCDPGHPEGSVAITSVHRTSDGKMVASGITGGPIMWIDDEYLQEFKKQKMEKFTEEVKEQFNKFIDQSDGAMQKACRKNVGDDFFEFLSPTVNPNQKELFDEDNGQ